jgi:nucleotide-binding universal stress UspA family protein
VIVTVVGATGRKDKSLVGIGRVAGRVVEHGLGTVLVVGGPSVEGNWRALVAVDGSQESQYALNALRLYFDLPAAELTVLHVVENALGSSGSQP